MFTSASHAEMERLKLILNILLLSTYKTHVSLNQDLCLVIDLLKKLRSASSRNCKKKQHFNNSISVFSTQSYSVPVYFLEVQY